MRIGIIGAGHIGGTLTRRLAALGHEVAVANSRGPDTLAGLAAETGARAATIPDAVQGAQLVIVTVPERAVTDLPKDVFAALPRDVPLVDTCNYYPRQRDGSIDEIEDGLPESRWVERQLGHPVIKAFNTIYFRNLLEKGRPAGGPDRLALPVAGDDAAAKAIVMRVIDELGFDPVDAGGLDDSWRQQPETPVYNRELGAAGVTRALAEATPGRRPEMSARG